MANAQHGMTQDFHAADCGNLNAVLGDPHCKRCGGLMICSTKPDGWSFRLCAACNAATWSMRSSCSTGYAGRRA
jgi:hypothetical protein